MPELGAILTAIITPFDADGRVDEDAFVAVQQHVCATGSDGVVVAGTTGEAPTLTDDEQMRILELAIRNKPAGSTVIAGTGSNDTRHAVHLTERATELGADGILTVTPYYNKPNRRGLKRHYEEIARATDKPVVLYNIPSRCVVDISNDELARLAEIPNVSAVKQARYDDIQPIEGLDLLAGNDDVLAEVLDKGGTGGICVATHIVGTEMRRMIDEPDVRKEIHSNLGPLFKAMAVTTNPIPVKTALRLLGHSVGGFRLPMIDASPEEEELIRGALEQHGLLSAV